MSDASGRSIDPLATLERAEIASSPRPPLGSDAPRDVRLKERVLLANVLVVAICGLIYELVCGTLASYLLGNAVLQFSLLLGTYVFAMGVGAWASGALEKRAVQRYVQTELVLALVGGLSVPCVLLGHEAHAPLRPLLHGVVFVIGALVGVELPLLVAILRARPSRDDGTATESAETAITDGSSRSITTFGDVVARALAYDYVGALVASLLFPLLLIPHFGLVKTAAAFGAVNALSALSVTFVAKTSSTLAVRAAGCVVLALLALVFVRGEAWVSAVTD